MGSKTILITYPFTETTNRTDKKQRIQLIDVSGERRFRQQSWSQFYDQIHGLIFVFDASERNRFKENQEVLADLLEDDQIQNKPILIFANKQDQRGAITNEHDVKRKLNIERLKTKHKLELCTALPQDDENNVDESIQQGFSWLIQTITDNYTALNSRINKTKNTRKDKQLNHSLNDENGINNKHLFEKNTDPRSKITSEKLPSINLNKSKTKAYSDDENEEESHGYTKKKKVLGTTNSNQASLKKTHDNQLKAFRSTYESFPEETPWSISTSLLKATKSDDTLSRLNTRTSLTNDLRRRDVSPLVHDLRSYTNGSSFKRDNYNDDEEQNFNYSQKSKPNNRFSSNIGKSSTSTYDKDDYQNSRNRHTLVTTKKPYDDDDDDDYSTSKSQNRSRYDDDDDRYTSKPNTNSKYNDYDDDDNNDHYGSSKPTTHSTYNNANRSFPSSKPVYHSKYDEDDDDYPPSSSRAVGRSSYNDDNDDEPNAPKKSNYTSSYNNYNGDNGYRSHYGNESFFTSNNGLNSSSRSRKSTYYDD
ncbi:hypothetical protein I4U23_024373 [Adineta vaga]|nr:hypothetical protein I4U23_024373 [Adineta vaga]